MSNKIFIFVPNPKLLGGVSHYYQTARKYFTDDVKYLYFNARYTKGLLKIQLNLFQLLKSIISIFIFSPRTVVVNPSLARNSILRDGLIVFTSHILQKKTIVFWRGWNPNDEFLLKSGITGIIFRSSLKSAETHIVLNKNTQKSLINNNVDKSKITFSNTIVDDCYFYDKSTKYTNKQKFIILFLTRIEKYKGIYETIEIFKRLKEELENIELHIAGNGNEIDNIKNLVHNQNITGIKFLGYVTGLEKIKVYQNSDVYLFPSYSEGMPNSVLEAMGAGLPVVCTKVGALEDFFKDGYMGFSHDLPINIDLFVSSITSLFYDKTLRIAISDYNKEYAEENFMASTTINKLEKIFKA